MQRVRNIVISGFAAFALLAGCASPVVEEEIVTKEPLEEVVETVEENPAVAEEPEDAIIEADSPDTETEESIIDEAPEEEVVIVEEEPVFIKKTIDELAAEVIRGEWGSGEARKQALTDAGYDASAVQERVNELLPPPAPAPVQETYYQDSSSYSDESYTGYLPHDGWGLDGMKVNCGGYEAILHYDVSESGQWTADQPYSCQVNDFLGQVTLADHAYQGFSAIKYNNVMYINGVRLVKVSQYTGVNTGDGLWLDDGRYVRTEVCDSWLMAYTCNDEAGYYITVTYWVEG